MIFSSITFLFAFLPLFLLCYFAVPFKGKNLVLLLFSLVFYAWGEPVYILLMIYSIIVNFFLGKGIEEYPEKKKGTLVFAIALNLFILGFFKYYGFLIENINALFGLAIPIKKLALPIGISFYTFQTLSYIIDLYKGNIKCQKNMVSFAAYITMFPQLIAGPIVRYTDIEEKLDKRVVDLEAFGKGSEIFIFGLAQKVILANGIGQLFDNIKALGDNISVLSAWLGAFAYTFQIFFDFCGYSTMAIGLGKMMGFEFVKNFDYPYISKSVTEFWRRWHISLGNWFREYVYIPLGGNRCGRGKHMANIMLVWLLTGLWHGASWNFIMWGVYYGVLLIAEKYLLKKVNIPSALGHILTMLFVVIGWVVFSADNIGAAANSLLAMFGMAKLGLYDSYSLYYLSSYGILFVLCIFCSLPLIGRLAVFLRKKCPFVMGMACLGMLFISVASLVSSTYNPFLYFRF